MGGVSFPGVPAPVVRWLRTEGYTAFSSFTHLLTLPQAVANVSVNSGTVIDIFSAIPGL
jgi:hypothetical protein